MEEGDEYDDAEAEVDDAEEVIRQVWRSYAKKLPRIIYEDGGVTFHKFMLPVEQPARSCNQSDTRE